MPRAVALVALGVATQAVHPAPAALQVQHLTPVSASSARAVAPQAVVGDLIVKFRDAAQPGPALALRLATDLKVPLRFVQPTSGREALLAVDRPALAQDLARRAAQHRGVARAELPPAAITGLPPQHLELRLRVRSGVAAAALSALPERLAVAGVRPLLQPASDGTVSLLLDLDAVTAALLARIVQRADVEYAQANRLLRPMNPMPPR